MIVARAYMVMTWLRVEVTCVHGEDHEAGHLVLRQDVPDVLDADGAFRALAGVLEAASWLVHTDVLEVTDECGW